MLCASAAAAKSQFEAKFKDKTRNQWSDRANFQSVPGKYTLIERDYSADTDSTASQQDDDNKEQAEDTNVEKKEKQSELDERVQALVRLICDVSQRTDGQNTPTLTLTSRYTLTSDSVVALPFVPIGAWVLVVLCCFSLRHDAQPDGRNRLRRLPSASRQAKQGSHQQGLGTRTRRSSLHARTHVEQGGERNSQRCIHRLMCFELLLHRACACCCRWQGYSVLKQLSDELSAGGGSRNRLVDLSNSFFSLIPHSFGRSVPPVIDSMPKLKAKLDMVEVKQHNTTQQTQRWQCTIGGDGRSNRRVSLMPSASCCRHPIGFRRRWERLRSV